MKNQIPGKILLITLVFSMIASCCVFAVTAEDKTPVFYEVKAEDKAWYDDHVNDSEYTINTFGELAYFAELAMTNVFSGKTIKLGADIECNKGTASETGFALDDESTDLYKWRAIGPNTTYPFGGTFDGQGHTLSGFYMHSSGASNYGLFGMIKNATVKNVNFRNNYFLMSNSSAIIGCGGLVAGVNWGNSTVSGITVSDCYMMNSMEFSQAIGGLVGYDQGTLTVSDCVVDAVIRGAFNIGGIVGYVKNNQKCYLNDCASYSTISAGKQTAGLVGHACGSVFVNRCVGNCEFGEETPAETSAQLVYLDRREFKAGGEWTAAASVDQQTVEISDSFYLGAGNAIAVSDVAGLNNYKVTFKYAGAEDAVIEGEGNVNTAGVSAGARKAASETASDNAKVAVVGCQDAKNGETRQVRFVATLTSVIDAKYVGFKIRILSSGGYKDLEKIYCGKVYTTILANNGAEEIKASDFLLSDYLYALIIDKVPANGVVTFIVTPFSAITEDAPEYGKTAAFTYANGIFTAAEAEQ